MIITFNPPLRETVHVASPSLIPQIQTTPLLFTAQLSALDHAQLVREGGRIQLWSDLPRHDKANGGWSELEFIDANEPKEPLSRAYTVSLRSSPRARDTQIKNLYLSIILPPTNSEAQQFSFTYRIVYPSGRTTWLSDFGQNGSLVLTVPEPNVLSGLVLQEPWAVDPSRQARIFHNGEGIDTLEVAKITRISDFRIQALGKDGFIPNLTNASVLFFVPRLHGNALAILPTYVMTASPGLTMSVSTEGRVTISGSGTVLLQSDVMQEAGPFIQQVLLHSTLDNWNILASDSKSKAVVLASSGPTYPIHAAVIPLWPSEDIQLPLGLDFSKLTAALASIEMQEFALFTSSKQQMHIFNLQQTEAQKVEKILLDFDSDNGDFTLAPIYRLRMHDFPNKIHRNWGAAILTHYNAVSSPFFFSDSGVLPTPPPSPHLHPIAFLSQQITATSIETRISSVSSLDADIGISVRSPVNDHENSGEFPQDPFQDPEDSDESEELNATPPPALAKHSKPVTPRTGIIWVFKCIFASVKAFFRVLYKFVFGPMLPAVESRPAGQPNPSSRNEDTPRVDDTDDYLDDSPEDAPGDEISSDQVCPSSSHIRAETQTITTTILSEDDIASEEETRPSEPNFLLSESVGLEPVRTENAVIPAASRLPGRSDKGDDVFYAEVRCFNEDDTTPAPKTATVEIVLLPLATNSTTTTVEEGRRADVKPTPSQNGFLEKAVKFIHGSGPLACVVTRIEAFSCPRDESEQEKSRGEENMARNSSDFVAYLLQYRLEWEDTRKGKLIGVSSPLEPTG